MESGRVEVGRSLGEDFKATCASSGLPFNGALIGHRGTAGEDNPVPLKSSMEKSEWKRACVRR